MVNLDVFVTTSRIEHFSPWHINECFKPNNENSPDNMEDALKKDEKRMRMS